MNSQLVYKLTNNWGQTRGNTQWAPGVTHSGTGKGELCGPGFIHYYSDPLLAILLNPIHGDFSSPRLWEAKPSGKILSDNGLKFGSESLTTIREIPLPKVTTEHRVRFAILCALEVYKSPEFLLWAENWLSGVDRSGAGAWEAAWAALAARAAVEAALAAEAAARAAARAAEAAARAAEAACSKSFDLVALAKKALA